MSDKIDLRMPWEKSYDAIKKTIENEKGAFLAGFVAGERHAQDVAVKRFEDFVRGWRVDK